MRENVQKIRGVIRDERIIRNLIGSNNSAPHSSIYECFLLCYYSPKLGKKLREIDKNIVLRKLEINH